MSLEDALGYLDLLAEQMREKLERPCVRWHGQLDTPTSGVGTAEMISAAKPVCTPLQPLPARRFRGGRQVAIG